MKNKLITIAKTLHPTRVSTLATYLLKDEAISGKLIIIAVILALIVTNTPLATYYEALWSTNLSIGVGDWLLSYDLRHWVNDALMAIFFLVVGLELKRELVTGELRQVKTAILPIGAALGGMIVPAAIYMSFNVGGDSFSGWAIPMATDIAIVIGLLALLGRRIPSSIRLFLLALAIVDDIAAVIVIAIFYSAGISVTALGLVLLLAIGTIILQKAKLLSLPLFAIISVVLWLLINSSGVHPSIAGVIIGLLAPITVGVKHTKSIAERLEHFMIPVSTLFVVPLFTFANAGIVLSISSFQNNSAVPIAAGIFFGLIIGKVVGIILASWLMIQLKITNLPNGSDWRHIISIGLLAGVGFTVSIFVTELAFDDQQYIATAKMSIFIASFVSGILGYTALRYYTKPVRQ